MPTVVAVLVLAVVAVAAIVAALLAMAAARRSRTSLADAQRQQADSAIESAALHDRVGELERRLARPAPATPEFVITHLGEPDDADRDDRLPAPTETRVTLTAPAFADAVLRETALHTVAFVHGVRRALAAETRHRIRFEMKRELKRSRKARKLEVKTALREYRARQRAGTGEPAA